MSQVLRSRGPMRSSNRCLCVTRIMLVLFGGSKKGSAQSSGGIGFFRFRRRKVTAANPKALPPNRDDLLTRWNSKPLRRLKLAYCRNVGAADLLQPAGNQRSAGRSGGRRRRFQRDLRVPALAPTHQRTADLRANHYCAPSASTRAATTLGATIMVAAVPESQAAEFASSERHSGNSAAQKATSSIAHLSMTLRGIGSPRIDVVIPDDYMPYSKAIDARIIRRSSCQAAWRSSARTALLPREVQNIVK